jgi:hypothetical protein
MDPHVTGAMIGLAGAVLAGALAVLGNWLNRQHELRRSKSEWFRDKLLEAYSGALYYLMKLGISSMTKSAKDSRQVRQHYSEAQRYLLLLRAFSTRIADFEQLSNCVKDLVAHWDKPCLLAERADAASDIVQALLEADNRVKPTTQRSA